MSSRKTIQNDRVNQNGEREREKSKRREKNELAMMFHLMSGLLIVKERKR
jgi:hypothetical protein